MRKREEYRGHRDHEQQRDDQPHQHAATEDATMGPAVTRLVAMLVVWGVITVDSARHR